MKNWKMKAVFIGLFTVVALALHSVNFSALVGSDSQFFTLFQLLGPIAGGVLGPIAGAISVLGTDVLNFFFVGKELSLVNVLRLTPMFVAAYYFGVYRKQNAQNELVTTAIPLVAIALFLLSPVGQQVWYFALYWTIPLIVKFLPSNLVLRSLGATFTAHAMGSIVWTSLGLWTVESLLFLVPVVAFERAIFALGIAFSFIVFTTILARIETLLPENTVHVEQQYDLQRVLKNLVTQRTK